MKSIPAGLILLAMAALCFVSGCAKSASKAEANTFDSAPPEIKTIWDQALTADKANDYVGGAMGYKLLLGQRAKLSEAQIRTVEETSSRLFQRLVQASTQGDPAAREALNTLGAMDRGQIAR